MQRPMDEHAPAIEHYRELFRAAHGTEPKPPTFAEFLYCHSDAEEAETVARRYLSQYFLSVVKHYEFAGTHFGRDEGLPGLRRGSPHDPGGGPRSGRRRVRRCPTLGHAGPDRREAGGPEGAHRRSRHQRRVQLRRACPSTRSRRASSCSPRRCSRRSASSDSLGPSVRDASVSDVFCTEAPIGTESSVQCFSPPRRDRRCRRRRRARRGRPTRAARRCANTASSIPAWRSPSSAKRAGTVAIVQSPGSTVVDLGPRDRRGHGGVGEALAPSTPPPSCGPGRSGCSRRTKRVGSRSLRHHVVVTDPGPAARPRGRTPARPAARR